MTEQDDRDAMFAEWLAKPPAIRLVLSRPQAEMIAAALLEYIERRGDHPLDAQHYYYAQVAAIRAQIPGAFPVTYNED